MKYSMGDSLADYGFQFYEKLHAPIFLLHRNGTIKKINEAGRKLLSIAHIAGKELDHLAKCLVEVNIRHNHVEYKTYETKRKQFKVISKQLESSDYYLIELVR
jgi:hypothetical protein